MDKISLCISDSSSSSSCGSLFTPEEITVADIEPMEPPCSLHDQTTVSVDLGTPHVISTVPYVRFSSDISTLEDVADAAIEPCVKLASDHLKPHEAIIYLQKARPKTVQAKKKNGCIPSKRLRKRMNNIKKSYKSCKKKTQAKLEPVVTVISESYESTKKKTQAKLEPVVTVISESYKSTKKKTQAKLEPVVKVISDVLPVITAVAAIVFMSTDQGSDVASAYEICNTLCSCVFGRFRSSGGSCLPPYNSLEQCVDVFVNNTTTVYDHCFTARSETECRQRESWSPKTMRHPTFCWVSIIAIAGPSIINSTYLVIRMLITHPSLWKNAGLTITLLLLYILQLLPYAWLVVLFVINLKLWMGKHMDGYNGKDTIVNGLKKTKVVFTILEDVPQTMLHSMFIALSVLTYDAPTFSIGLDMLHVWSYVGLSSSAASIALTLTLNRELSSYKLACLHFFNNWVSVGARALVCASFASAVQDVRTPRTWPLILPPATAIVLYSIVNTLPCVYTSARHSVITVRQTGIIRHIRSQTHSLYEWITNTNCRDWIQMILKNGKQLLMNIISLTFEANSAQCLLTSYIYLAFAVAINAAWIPHYDYVSDYSLTKTFLLTIQYLSLTSCLLNLLMVQWASKDKCRCLAYSLIFLMFMGGIFNWVKTDLNSMFFLFHSRDLYLDIDVTLQSATQMTLQSLNPVFIISGITASINLLILITSFMIDCYISNKNIENLINSVI